MVDKVDFAPSLLGLLFLLSGVVSYTEFEISVANGGLVGVYGQPVVLTCSFPTGSSWDMGSSVITWQRGLEVVHSFYHSRDQLDRQNPHYVNRTSLYREEMAKGNASLRLDQVTLEDEGLYTCSVSTQIGSQKKSFRLKVAAFYPEPHLHINVLKNGQVDLLVTSQGGYPAPSLQWLMGSSEDITNKTQMQLQQHNRTKLYSMNSKLNITQGCNSSITFILKNEDLGQEIVRNIDFFSENEGAGGRSTKVVLYVFLLVAVIAVIVGLTVFLRVRKNKKCKQDCTRTAESSAAICDDCEQKSCLSRGLG